MRNGSLFSVFLLLGIPPAMIWGVLYVFSQKAPWWLTIIMFLVCILADGCYIFTRMLGQSEEIRRQLRIVEDERDSAIQAAGTDPLTGLFNRRGAKKEAERLLRIHNRRGFAPSAADSNVTPMNQSVAVVYLDLDNFKRVNDTLGHQMGDLILQLAVEIIRRFFARPTDIVCRQGGDEFVVILTENVKVEVVVDQLRKLQEVFVAELWKLFKLNHHQKDDPRIAVTVSCGVAAVSVSKEEVTDLDSLIRQADDSMYRAKQMGKNQVVVG